MKKKGSFTVEVSLILPIIIFIIVGLIYLSFLLHDKVMIKNVCSEYLMDILDTNKSENEIKQEIKKKIENYTFIIKIYDMEILENDEKKIISVSYGYDLPFSNIKDKDICRAKVYKRDRGSYMRMVKVMIDTIKDIKE